MLRKLLAVLFLILTSLGFIAGNVNAANEQAKQKVVFADAGWDSVKFHNAVAGFIGTHAYNITPKIISGSTPIIQTALLRGDVDVHMELWTDNVPTFEADMKTGKLLNLGINFDDDKQGLYVPRYLIEGDAKRGIKALAPDIKVIAPWRDDRWGMDSREAEIEYCKAHGIDLPFGTDQSYSRDRNIWHISHEGLELEDPAQAPNYDHMLVLGVTPEKAPDEDVELSISFEKGVPTALNGKKMKVADIIRELNTIGGKHGIGIVDIVENRVVGMKSRGVYETPGGTILMEAHQQLEELILDRDTMTVKKDMGNKFAQIVYEGKWFTPLREAVQAFVESTQKYVTGEVKFKLYKGNIIKAGTTSPYSLYSESLASFTTGDLYDHHDAEGFITLFGLPLKVRAMKMAEIEKNK